MPWGEGSGDQAGFLGELHSLRAPPGAKLVKQAARVRLHGVFTDKQALRDFSRAEADGDRDRLLIIEEQRPEAFLVGHKWSTHGRHLLDDDVRFLPGEGQAQPDAKRRKQRGDQAAIDFQGVLENQKTVFGQLQDSNEPSAAQTVEQDVPQGPTARG